MRASASFFILISMFYPIGVAAGPEANTPFSIVISGPQSPVKTGSDVRGWQWSGDAAYNAGNQTWTLNSSSKSANSFGATSTYPTWSRYSDYSSQSCH